MVSNVCYREAFGWTVLIHTLGLHFHPAGYEIMYREVTKLIAELWPDQVAEKLPTVLPLWNDAAAWSS